MCRLFTWFQVTCLKPHVGTIKVLYVQYCDHIGHALTILHTYEAAITEENIIKMESRKSRPDCMHMCLYDPHAMLQVKPRETWFEGRKVMAESLCQDLGEEVDKEKKPKATGTGRGETGGFF